MIFSSLSFCEGLAMPESLRVKCYKFSKINDPPTRWITELSIYDISLLWTSPSRRLTGNGRIPIWECFTKMNGRYSFQFILTSYLSNSRHDEKAKSLNATVAISINRILCKLCWANWTSNTFNSILDKVLRHMHDVLIQHL